MNDLAFITDEELMEDYNMMKESPDTNFMGLCTFADLLPVVEAEAKARGLL